MTSSQFDSLRAAAEKALERGEIDPGVRREIDPDRAIEELRIRQAELELQNNQLRSLQQQAESDRMRYRALFDALPLPTLLIDAQGLVQEANSAALETLGFRSRDRLYRHSVFRLIEGNALESFSTTARTMLQGETRSLGLTWLRRHDRSPLPIDLHLTALRVSYHLDRHFLLTCLDQSATLERDNQSRLLESILENSEAAIYAFDTEGRMLLANPTTRRLFTAGEQSNPIGQLRSTLVPPESEALYARHDLKVFRKRQSALFEETLHQSDGSLRHFVSQKFPVIDERGNVIAVGGVSTEITALKTMNARWQLAAKVFENGSEAIIVTDADQRITMVNRCFTETTGYTEEEVLGRTPDLLASGQHDEHFFDEMFETIEKRGHWEGEIWNRRKQGDVYPEWMRIAEVRDADGNLQNYVSISRDISQRKSAEEQINNLAFYDPLTGLPNRELLRDRTQQVIAQAHRDGSSFAMCFLDLDQFKQVNDAFGHGKGDQLLIKIARRLHRQLREQDTISRIGGDEFVLVLPQLNPDAAGIRLRKILDTIRQPVELDTNTITLSGSMGIAMYPEDGESFDDLLRASDTAMYQAKHAGRNCQRFFSSEMGERTRRRMQIEMALDQAIGNDEFQLHYQPSFVLSENRLSGCEALLRWHSSSLGQVGPGEFIPVAEQSGRIIELGQWVLDTALAQRRQWQDRVPGDYTVAVNMSAQEFHEPELIQFVAERLQAHGLPPQLLELEVTERTAMRDPEFAIDTMSQLKALGVRLSIDDFGTGYSSLAYLRSMPVDRLKMDISFVSEIGRSREGESICSFVIGLARMLGIDVVAEGVETAFQKDFLIDLGCRYAQGYLLGKPIPADAFGQQIQQARTSHPTEAG